MRSLWILCLVVACIVILPRAGRCTEPVQGTGVTVILRGDVETARNRAVNKAFEGAMAQALEGLFQFPDASEFNRAAEVIFSDDLLAYVDRYRFISDRRQENLYRVTVEVWVGGPGVSDGRLVDSAVKVAPT